jgi:hypothetical protein
MTVPMRALLLGERMLLVQRYRDWCPEVLWRRQAPRYSPGHCCPRYWAMLQGVTVIG